MPTKVPPPRTRTHLARLKKLAKFLRTVPENQFDMCLIADGTAKDG